MTITTTEIKGIVNNLLVDDHIKSNCTELVPTCYKIFYATDQMDVTFNITLTEYTIPNMAKNVGVPPLDGIVDPENAVIGIFGQIYYNSQNKKVFFKGTEEESMNGWVELFQYVASPSEDEVMDNITELLISAEDAVTTYYNMFYIDTPMDIVFKFYDKNTKQLVDKTVPNCAKARKIGMSGEGNPEGFVSATLGTIYVDVIAEDAIYIKTTSSGVNGWYKLLNYSKLVEHNSSATAHQGYLARLHGDEDQYFNAKDPIAETHAVTLNYTGSLKNLKTADKSNFVNAINEIETGYELLKDKFSLASAQAWSMVSGNVNASGESDLILCPTDTGTFYEDVTAELFEDNTNQGIWYDTKGSTDNYYYWGNKGVVFGGKLGEGFQGWSYLNGTPYGATEDNMGQTGHPIIHTFSPALGAGTYIFAVCGNGHTFSLKATYDGTEHTITLPNGLTDSEWSYTTPITVETGLESLSAVGNTNIGTWGIGSIHVLKQKLKSSYLSNIDKVYFKVGPYYKPAVGVDAEGTAIEQIALPSIDLTNVSNGTYKVFYNASGFNRNAFKINGNSAINDEGVATIFNEYSNIQLDTAINNSKFDITIQHKTQDAVSLQSGQQTSTATIYSAKTANTLKVEEYDVLNTQTEVFSRYLRISLGNGTSWFKPNWDVCSLEGNTDYLIRLTLENSKYKVFVNGTQVGEFLAENYYAWTVGTDTNKYYTKTTEVTGTGETIDKLYLINTTTGVITEATVAGGVNFNHATITEDESHVLTLNIFNQDESSTATGSRAVSSDFNASLGNLTGLYIGSDLTNSTNGSFYLPDIKIISNGVKTFDGTFVGPYLLSKNIYYTKTTPVGMNAGDIWKNVSVSPVAITQYDGTIWREFKDIPMGEVTITSNKVTAVKMYPYCNRKVSTPNSVSPAYVVEAYESGSSWYRLWSNNMLEQGGQLSASATAQTITLLKAYKNSYYNVATGCSTGTITIGSKTAGQFVLTGSASSTCTWKTIGYIN